MSNLQKLRGDHGQNTAARALEALGVNMVEKIGNAVPVSLATALCKSLLGQKVI